MEFFNIADGTTLQEQQADEKYERFGGAAGDLLLAKKLPTAFMSKWDRTAQAVLFHLVMAQSSSSEDKPWNLRPISGRAAHEILQYAKPGCSPALELQQLCDLYLLERDDKDQYHVAYPEAIHHCDPFDGRTPTDRFIHAQVHSSSPYFQRTSYTNYSFLLGMSGK